MENEEVEEKVHELIYEYHKEKYGDFPLITFKSTVIIREHISINYNVNNKKFEFYGQIIEKQKE